MAFPRSDDGSDEAPAGHDPTGAVLFTTAIGRCGVAWAGERVTVVELPGVDDRATMAGLVARAGGRLGTQPPPMVAAATAAMAALLEGEPIDLRFVEVDLDAVSDFERAVYDVTRSIPAGATLTYGEVARRVGQPGASQAVGRALGANPAPIVIPCHRVLGARGRLVGFSANGGTTTKRRILLIEGAPAVPPSLFD